MSPNVLLAFAAASAVLAGALSAGAAPDRGPAFPRTPNCYAAGLYRGATEAELRRVAQYDLLSGGVDLNADAEIARVRQLNPHILILPYVILREYEAGGSGRSWSAATPCPSSTASRSTGTYFALRNRRRIAPPDGRELGSCQEGSTVADGVR